MVNLSGFYAAVVLLWGFRLRVTPLSLSPSCVTHYKTSSEHLFPIHLLGGAPTWSKGELKSKVGWRFLRLIGTLEAPQANYPSRG